MEIYKQHVRGKYKQPDIQIIELERTMILAESHKSRISQNGEQKGETAFDDEQDYETTQDTWNVAY